MAKKSKIMASRRVPRFPTQARSRCNLCGRPRGYMRRFALCRICFRIHASQGHIPGVRKSSW